MKISNAFAILGFISLALNNFSYAGVGAGGGGDAVSQDFIRAGLAALSYVSNHPGTISINLKSLAETVQKTSVESTNEELNLGSKHKSAINYPDSKQIIVSRVDWANLTENSKKSLALHEYLGIMRVNDQNYQLSTQLLQLHFNTMVCEVLLDSSPNRCTGIHVKRRSFLGNPSPGFDQFLVVDGAAIFAKFDISKANKGGATYAIKSATFQDTLLFSVIFDANSTVTDEPVVVSLDVEESGSTAPAYGVGTAWSIGDQDMSMNLFETVKHPGIDITCRFE